MKDRRLNFRLAQWQDEIIRKKAQEAGRSISDYVLLCALGKDIYNYNGLYALASQIKRINNNLNQLVILARQGRFQVAGVESIREEIAEMNGTLNQELRKARD